MTLRPEITGSFGMVASTHWAASAAGFGMLERGGNAFDAAVAAGFALQVLEPHLNGPGGDLPAVFHSAATGRTEVLCAQGVAPERATIQHYRAEGLDRVPGTGLLATVTPGAFDGWMLLLRDHGRLRLQDVLSPAIRMALGHPLLPRAAATVAAMADHFRAEWPSSADVWLPHGAAPRPDAVFANLRLARTYAKIVRDAEGGTREDEIEAARAQWRFGFVADAIDRFFRGAELMDSTGEPHRGVLTGDDLAAWEAHYESPVKRPFGGLTLAKTGPWGQGPVLLQTLGMLEAAGIADLDPLGEAFAHHVVEALKLAMADREAFYGDPAASDVPLDALLDPDHARARAALIGAEASRDQRPSRLPGLDALADAAIARAAAPVGPDRARVGGGEPTMGHLGRGDTVHLDVADAEGNMVSATPSGGWLQSSPAVPGLGFCLNTRAQMFWLEPGLPSSLAPGRRPRTTLSPTLGLRDGLPVLALGTPGGDQQDQWQATVLIRHLCHGMSLQEAIEAPLFHTLHATSSFAPRAAEPGVAVVEPELGEAAIQALRARGHEVRVTAPRAVGRLTAVSRRDGVLRGAATPRLGQAYAVGR